MKLRPLHDRVVVERLEKGEQIKGGIVIPDSAKEKPQQGKVIAVGNGRRLENGKLIGLDVRVGDHILFGKYGGSEISVEGSDYLILREDEVLAVMESAKGSKAQPTTKSATKAKPAAKAKPTAKTKKKA